MKNRIIQIMNAEGMNASQFAEAIGIQRAAMSHILAERNNPSLDVVKRILRRFKNIQPDWLLHGEGSMMRVNDITTETDLFVQPPLQQPLKESDYTDNIRKEKLFTDEKQHGEVVYESKNEAKDIVKETIIYQERPSKTIEKLLIFYSDRTYETFVMES